MRKYADRYVVIVIISKYKNDFYFCGRRQGCEIQFSGLLYTREVLISRRVAHKIGWWPELVKNVSVKLNLTSQCVICT
jgi:hypothetical protein